MVWVIGRKHTPEARAKMSAAQTGKKHTPETRAKMSAARTGKKHTPETRANMSAALMRARVWLDNIIADRFQDSGKTSA